MIQGFGRLVNSKTTGVLTPGLSHVWVAWRRDYWRSTVVTGVCSLPYQSTFIGCLSRRWLGVVYFVLSNSRAWLIWMKHPRKIEDRGRCLGCRDSSDLRGLDGSELSTVFHPSVADLVPGYFCQGIERACCLPIGIQDENGPIGIHATDVGTNRIFNRESKGSLLNVCAPF